MYFPRFGVWLYQMPYDKQDDCFTNIHATGRMVLLQNDDYPVDDLRHNIWVNEYENNAYDVATFGYEDERGYIIPLTDEEFMDDLEYIEWAKSWTYQNEACIDFDDEDAVAEGEGFWKINADSDREYHERRW